MTNDPTGLSGSVRIGRIEDRVTDHGRRINDLEGWRDTVRGERAMLRAIFGASILNGIGVVVAIWAALGGSHP